MRPRLTVCSVLLFLFSFQQLPAEEGMWLLDAVPGLPLAGMRNRGFALDPADIAGTDGSGIMSAVVLLGGGTGSFISSTGLIMTNHHVAYGAIQALSTVDHDYLRDGFLARSRDNELTVQTTAEIVLSTKDVTGDVLSVVTPAMSEAERTKAIQGRMRALEADARGTGPLTCRVVELYQGVRYALFTSVVLRDLRLVYAPPSSIGNFGGETDNWIWPRHTGDFSILRAYAAPDGSPAPYAKENVPYVPRRFLPVSRAGFADGDFAMAIGFPGRTYRYREAAEVEDAFTRDLPATIFFYRLRIDAMTAATVGRRDAEIRYASKIRRLANPYKKYLGILEGMRRIDLPSVKRREEERLGAWIAAVPERTAAYGTLLKEIDDAHAAVGAIEWKNACLANLNGIDLLAVARRFVTFTEGFSTDSLGHAVRPAEGQVSAMRDYLKELFRNYDETADRAVMVALLRAAGELPVSDRVETLRRITGDRTGKELEEEVRDEVSDLYAETGIGTLEGCLRMMEEDAGTILDDPFIHLAQQLAEEQAPLTQRLTAYNAAIAPLRRRYVEARMQWEGKDALYPDANRTIRLTYGRVCDLRPRDAVDLSYRTLLGGVMEKETQEEPFIVPARLRELWEKKDFGRYAERASGDVPVAFITDLDITGGNSGSPVINGRGELIGCAFDGNWESVVGDYVYQEEINRCISVDMRYVLFLLDRFAGAQSLLDELVIR